MRLKRHLGNSLLPSLYAACHFVHEKTCACCTFCKCAYHEHARHLTLVTAACVLSGGILLGSREHEHTQIVPDTLCLVSFRNWPAQTTVHEVHLHILQTLHASSKSVIKVCSKLGTITQGGVTIVGTFQKSGQEGMQYQRCTAPSAQ